jgi:flagellar hook-associated protein 2
VQSNGVATTGSYQIESKQLAQAHTLVANKVYGSPSDSISTGDLTINVGGQFKGTIPITASNNTLEGLQGMVNNGDYGVNASIINNGGQYQMMFSSKETGAASQISMTGLSDFNNADLTTTSSAQDAVMSINGLTISNSSNDFSDVIDGLNIQLKSVSASPQSVAVASDSQKVVESVTKFVEVYNQLDTIVDDLGSYKELTPEEQDSPDFDFFGDLSGSSLLRDLKGQVRGSLSGAISQLTDPNTLASVGISFDVQGQLSLDSTVLNNAVDNNLDALSRVFSKNGASSDPLINVTGSSDATQAGSYAVNVSQTAERATVSSAGANPTTDGRLAGERITDMTSVLSVDASAAFSISLGVAAAVPVDLGTIPGTTYSSKDAFALAMDSALSTQGIPATFAYDSAQSRFEITANSGAGDVDISGVTGFANQGLSATTYSSQPLIDLNDGGANASFDVAIDGSTASPVSIASGRYTADELANVMQGNINNNSDVQAAGGKVTVSYDTTNNFSVTSNRFGINSNVTLNNLTNLGNAGLTTNLTDAGLNVDGTITTAAGTLSLGAYADSEDGRQIKISDFAVISGEPATVRGLDFEVLGGADGARGNIEFSQGFASRLDETIKRLFEADHGLVTDRMESLSNRSSEYDDKKASLDLRYDKMLAKYQLQFSALQGLLSSTQQTSDFLTATFSNNNNN